MDRLLVKKKLESSQALANAQKYCAYQERSHREVREKLYSFGLFKNQVEEILTNLITTGFLNEERFAKAFAGGKFRVKKWGRKKIASELIQKGVSKKCIQIGLTEIDESDYRKTLVQLLKKKNQSLTETNPYRRRHKVSAFVIAKGYEPELVWNTVMELWPERL